MPLEKLKSELGVHKRNQWGYRRENFLMHTMHCLTTHLQENFHFSSC